MQNVIKNYLFIMFEDTSELPDKSYVRITLASCVSFSLGNFVINHANGNKKLRNHYVMAYMIITSL